MLNKRCKSEDWLETRGPTGHPHRHCGNMKPFDSPWQRKLVLNPRASFNQFSFHLLENLLSHSCLYVLLSEPPGNTSHPVQYSMMSLLAKHVNQKEIPLSSSTRAVPHVLLFLFYYLCTPPLLCPSERRPLLAASLYILDH